MYFILRWLYCLNFEDEKLWLFCQYIDAYRLVDVGEFLYDIRGIWLVAEHLLINIIFCDIIIGQ